MYEYNRLCACNEGIVHVYQYNVLWTCNERLCVSTQWIRVITLTVYYVISVIKWKLTCKTQNHFLINLYKIFLLLLVSKNAEPRPVYHCKNFSHIKNILYFFKIWHLLWDTKLTLKHLLSWTRLSSKSVRWLMSLDRSHLFSDVDKCELNL